MNTTTQRLRTRAAALVAVGALTAAALVGCSSDATTDESTDTASALDTETTLTWWTWSDDTDEWAAGFTAEHPKIKIDIVKLDNPDAAVTKLQNAVKAGSGAPDIIPVEYQTLPQLTMSDALADLTPFGLASAKDAFTASTWNSVNVQDKLVGIPLDSGPMVMIYNTDLYAKAGVDKAPTTWAEFADASAKIRAYDPEAYIANSGDAGFVTSMIWSFGGKPFSVDGEKVTINLQDEGSKAFADFWGGLLQKGELSQIPTWSDEWNKALAAGKLGTLMMGSWMIGGPEDAGDTWRVAPMPTVDGTPASAENGGSAIAVTKQSKNKAAAAAVLEWLATGEGRDLVTNSGFPSTTATMEKPEWRDRTWPEIHGDQKANEVGAAAAASVITGWQYLPFQGYANNVFGDSVGKALGAEGDLNAALQEWQKTLVDYGNSQGFTVNK